MSSQKSGMRHYSFTCLLDKRLAVLRAFESDIQILDSDGLHISSFRFRKNTSPKVEGLSEQWMHCITQDKQGHIVIFDPLTNEICAFSIDGAEIYRFKSKFRILSLCAYGDDELLAVGQFQGSLLHVLNIKGNVLRSVALPKSEQIIADQYQGNHFPEGLLAISQNTFCHVVDPVTGVLESGALSSHKSTRTLCLTNPDQVVLSQMASGGTSDGYELVISWPALPLRARAISSDGDSGFLVLSGTGRHYLSMDSDLENIRCFQLPALASGADEAIYIARAASTTYVGLASGEIWSLKAREVSETTKREYLQSLFKPYVQVGNYTLGPNFGIVLTEESMAKNRDLWDSLGGGSVVYVLHVSRNGQVDTVRPISHDGPDSKSIDQLTARLRGMKFMTTGCSLGPQGVDLRVSIQIDYWARCISKRGNVTVFS